MFLFTHANLSAQLEATRGSLLDLSAPVRGDASSGGNSRARRWHGSSRASAMDPSSEPLLARGPLHKDGLQDGSGSIAIRGPNVEVSGGHWAVRSTEGLG